MQVDTCYTVPRSKTLIYYLDNSELAKKQTEVPSYIIHDYTPHCDIMYATPTSATADNARATYLSITNIPHVTSPQPRHILQHPLRGGQRDKTWRNIPSLPLVRRTTPTYRPPLSPISTPAQRPVGLPNVGNSCFLNAVLQCFLPCAELTTLTNNPLERWMWSWRYTY